MKTAVLEFSRPLEVARVPRLGATEKIIADANELVLLANRLKVPVIHSLSAELRAKPWRGGGLKITGEVRLDVEQLSVISLEQFRDTKTIEVERYFLAKIPQDATEEEEIDPILNGIVDLGELVAETLALELDLYPRKPGEEFGEKEIPPVEKLNPFAVLKLVKPQK